MSRLRIAAVIVLVGFRLSNAATFTVINTNDSGVGSLRQAILDANATANVGGLPDTIAFAVPGSGVRTISPASQLDGVTEAVVIDGWTQGGNAYQGPPLIEIEGTSAGSEVSGIILQAHTGSTVRGLCINRFTGSNENGIGGDGVRANAGGGHVIVGCYLGVDPTGTIKRANTRGGVNFQQCEGGRIGGTSAADRNVLSGNRWGILLDEASGVTIQGNYVGTDAAGTSALGNISSGIFLFGGAPLNENHIVGGSVAGAGNLISGNVGAGIFAGGSGHVIRANRIGTDPAGTFAIPNTTIGIQLIGTQSVTVGGPVPADGNLISGNGGAGIDVTEQGSTGTVVQNNTIGADVTGLLPLPNAVGITFTDRLFGVPTSATVGNVTGGGNRIAFNTGAGITAVTGVHASPRGITIRGNAIAANGGLGIDLENDNVTSNDAGLLDADGGANRRQNFPALSSAMIDGAMLHVQGTLDTLASMSFHVDFYASSAADPLGHGEGGVFLGSTTVMTNGSGIVAIDVMLSATVAHGSAITATATAPNGDTSEFSAAITAIDPNVPTTTTSTTTTSTSTTIATTTTTTITTTSTMTTSTSIAATTTTTTISSTSTTIASSTTSSTTTSVSSTTTTLVPDECPPSPANGCRAAAASSLMLRNARAAEKDTLAWMWKRGEATAREDFGDPLSATTYRVCLYANQQLVYAATVAAGGTCGAKPCWGTTKRGFAYADRAGAAGGLVRVRLDAGAVGKARIIATARGSQLTLPSLPLALPVDIRLHGAGTTCFGAVYDRARKNTATAFRGG